VTMADGKRGGGKGSRVNFRKATIHVKATIRGGPKKTKVVKRIHRGKTSPLGREILLKKRSGVVGISQRKKEGQC